MQLTVENVTTAKTGKSLRVKANGDWYGAKKDSGITAGMTIDAEVEDGEYGKWIKTYRATNAAPQTSSSTAGKAPAAAGAAPVWLPFASNTVAHAISAGLCQTPAAVEAWARAAKDAFEAIA